MSFWGNTPCHVARASQAIDISRGLHPGMAYITKIGRNQDVDILTVPEDIWDGGGTYQGWCTSAEPIVVFSSSANDAAAGTGARTVVIYGLDSDYNEISEIITLNGVGLVFSTKSFLRVHKGVVTTAGSVGSNVGNITCRNNVALNFFL